MICEMAAYLKSKGVTVLDFLESIYHEYGYYHHVQQSFVCEGEDGMKRIERDHGRPPGQSSHGDRRLEGAAD